MSTNYYARYNVCDCCNRYDEVHIGQSYRALQTQPALGIRSWTAWCTFLNTEGVQVFDEYDRQLDVAEFIQGWVPRQDAAQHVAETDKSWNYLFNSKSGDFLDEQGFYFVDREFS